jgi:hypothetical protein
MKTLTNFVIQLRNWKIAYYKIMLLLLVLTLQNCFWYAHGNYSNSPLQSIVTVNSVHNYPNLSRAFPALGEAKILKKGKSCTEGFLLVNTFYFKNEEDYTIEDAKRNGDITKVGLVDFESTQVGMLGVVFFAEQCMIVYGE